MKNIITGNNFLFVGVGKSTLPVSIIERLIKERKIENAYGVLADEDTNVSLFKETPISLNDAFVGKYPYESDEKPYDRAYQNPISEYSIEILHQMSRHGDWDFDKRVYIYISHLQYWDSFLEKRNINGVIFSNVPHETYDYVIYLLCRVKAIKTFMSLGEGYRRLETPRAFYMIEYLENHTTEVGKVYEELKKDYIYKTENDILLPEFVEQNIQKIRDKFENIESSNLSLMNKTRMRQINRYYGNPKLTFKKMLIGKETVYACIRSWTRYLYGIRKTKKLIYKYEKIAVQPDASDKYIFYALHYQPEATSSPLGGIYANQLLAIRLIAHNLPAGYWLYVKEHPAQTAFCREKSYYDELSRIPKIKLISQRITSEKLIKNALAVATLTGTVIYESQVIQKPCLCLGYTPLEILEGVYKIDTNEDCRKAIKEIIETGPKETTIKDLRLFYLAIEKICFSKMDEEEFYNKLLLHMGMV